MSTAAVKDEYPVVVVGGGLAGASFALAAAGPDCPVLVVEAQAPGGDGGGFDARSTALSFGTRRIFESLGVWDALGDAPCPIHRIEVSDQGHLGGVCFDHREQHLAALGYIIENHILGDALLQGIARSEHIELLAPADLAGAKPMPDGMALTLRESGAEREVNAGLVVLADGGRSPVAAQLGIGRQLKSYEQHALVANIALADPHGNTAFERFTGHGPLAVLPLPDAAGEHRASLVWTLPEPLARENLELPEDDLIARLQQDFGPAMGRVTGMGRRACFPLQLSRASEQARPGLVLLGNAAHTLHPVAGQGFNLALRDCMALATVLGEAAGQQRRLGEMAVLQRYLDQQEFDQEKTILFTDLLVSVFSGKNPAKALFRRLGLLAIDLLPPLRQRFVGNAMGLGLKT